MSKPKSERPETQRWIDRYFWHGLVSLIIFGTVVNVLVWFAPRQEVQVTLPSYDVNQVVAGRELYAANCATCHGAEGQGYARAGVPAPALNGDMHAWHHPDSQIAGFIRRGVGQMPAVGASWSDEDVSAVLAYIKQWWEPEQLAAQTQTSQQNP